MHAAMLFVGMDTVPFYHPEGGQFGDPGNENRNPGRVGHRARLYCIRIVEHHTYRKPSAMYICG